MSSCFPITAYLEGMTAADYDLEHSTLTDCPYWPEMMAAKQWWKGYHRAQRDIQSKLSPPPADSLVDGE